MTLTLNAIKTFATDKNTKLKTNGLIEFLDEASKKENYKFDSIKAYGVADRICQPHIPCVDMIDAVARCGKGIQNYIPKKFGTECPVKFAIANYTPIATANTTNTFTDQSGTYPLVKECLTLTPALQSITLDIEEDNCNFENCGNIKEYITSKIGEAIYNGTENQLVALFNAKAGTAITNSGGDIIDDLIKLNKEVKKVSTNKGKKIITFVNELVIDEILSSRDDNNNFIFDYKDTCPVTGCRTICVAGMTIVGLDDLSLSVSSTGITNIFCVCVDNVMYGGSNAKILERRWDTMLVDMTDRIVAMNKVAMDIPATLPNSVKKMVITL